MTRGIILAGGSGSRLQPLTSYITKQLLPIFNKPLIYYPLCTLMMAGIREILIISDKINTPRLKNFLKNGNQFGIRLKYSIQKKPNGIAEALIIGEKFIKDKDIYLILGDNIFHGHDLKNLLKNKINNQSTIFSYNVNDPSRYGVIKFKKNKIDKIIEKPKFFISSQAVTGLYFYSKKDKVYQIAKNLKKSRRGELEITDLNNEIIKRNKMNLFQFTRGYAWLDAGTFDSMSMASNLVKTIEERQGLLICSPEEIAYSNNWISKAYLRNVSKKMNNEYGRKLKELLND